MKTSIRFSTGLRTRSLYAAAALCLAALMPEYASAQTRIIVNQGLEFGVPNGTVAYLDTNFTSGGILDPGTEITWPWYTTQPVQSGNCAPGAVGNCHPIKVWGTGNSGVPAAQGTNFVELNAFTNSMMYQNMYLTNGDNISYYFRHRARTSTTEQAAMIIEDANQNIIDVIETTTLPSSTGAWSVNQGTHIFTGASGIYRIGFRSQSSTAPDNGNFVDDIRVSLKPMMDLKFSNPQTSCEGFSNGSVFIRVNGAVIGETRVALEITDPNNNNPVASDNDIILTGVPNINGTPSITHTPGSNVYLISIPPGNYDGGVTPGYSSPTNDIDGVLINVSSVNDGIDEPTETFRFTIREEGTNGSTDNFISTMSPVFGDTYYGNTDSYFIQRCICYDDANTSGPGINSNLGITLLNRTMGGGSANWPKSRKGAYAVLESNTKGFVLTRMTTQQINAITDPQDGMLVYDTTSKCLKMYDGNAWYCFNTPTCP